MPRTTHPLLEARGLTRRQPRERRGETARFAVEDLSFEVGRGEVLGLLGLNGAGKSTTLRMLAGALVPDAGTVIIDGHSMRDEPLAARRALGYLADQPPLYDDLRVTGYLAFCSRLRCVPEVDVAQSVAAVIEECNLAEVANRRIGTLSKGYRQRVGVAQALVHQPAVVLLDEPSNGLDPRQMEDLRSLIAQLGEHRAVVFSTHLLAEVRSVCDRIVVLHDGRLMADRALAEADDLATLFAGLVAA